MSTTITAVAAGSLHPVEASKFAVENGDFKISPNLGAETSVGDGVNETTKWIFDFTKHPKYKDFVTTGPIETAELTLLLMPKRSDAKNDTLCVNGMPDIMKTRISQLPIDQPSVLQLDLLAEYEEEELIDVIDSQHGLIEFDYEDDSVICYAELALSQ